MTTQIILLLLAITTAASVAYGLWFRSKLTVEQNRVAELSAMTADLTEVNTKLEIDRRVLEERMESQLREITSLQEQMKAAFENTLTKIIDERSTKMNASNIRQVEEVMRPYKDMIEQFRADAGRIQLEYTKQSTSVSEHIKMLAQQASSVGDRAENLARALTDNSKLRGSWGEMTLVSLLDMAGLVKDIHYSVQVAARGEEDRTSLLADVVVTMPEERKVVVDSKVSLVAYQKMVAAQTDEHRASALKEHIAAIKGCIDSLCKKEYHQKVDGAANFTMMFIPIEPAYLAAMNGDSSLWQYAYDRGVVLVSPTTLLPCLRIIADMWRQDKLNTEVQKIVDRGAKLYDKVHTFVESFYKVGKQLDSATQAFQSAKGVLEDGRGNVKWQAEELRKLGLKTKKRMEGGDAGDDLLDEELEPDLNDDLAGQSA